MLPLPVSWVQVCFLGTSHCPANSSACIHASRGGEQSCWCRIWPLPLPALPFPPLLCRGAAGHGGRQNTARPLPRGKGRAGQSLSPPNPITSSRVLRGVAAARGPLPAVPRSGDSALPAPGTAALSPGVIEMQTARAPRQSGWRERPCKLALHATYGSFVEVMHALCLTGERFICSQAEASVADRDSPVVLPLSGVKLQYKTPNRERWRLATAQLCWRAARSATLTVGTERVLSWQKAAVNK